MKDTATAKRNDFRRLPKTYGALVAMLPPRPIHDDVDLANATEMIDRLAGFDLNADQEDYLEALSTCVEAYEAKSNYVRQVGECLWCGSARHTT